MIEPITEEEIKELANKYNIPIAKILTHVKQGYINHRLTIEASAISKLAIG